MLVSRERHAGDEIVLICLSPSRGGDEYLSEIYVATAQLFLGKRMSDEL